ncbi:MAG: ABC transporter substrate-binding protein [Candidatus Thorarchaeota archaeon]
MDWRFHSAVGVVLLLVCVSGLSVVSASTHYGYTLPHSPNSGPHIDNIEYTVIPLADQRMLAIQEGDIEIDHSFFDPVHLNTLDWDYEIDIFSALQNGYGHLTINCRKYPLNISAFRRAFAYAFDKTAVTSEIKDGFSQEHDSLVPYTSGWCIEDDMPYHYYTAQVDRGNQILDRAGFTIDPGSGYRLAPDESPFNVVIEYASSSPEIAGGTAQIGVDALRALDVNATTRPTPPNEYISRLDQHGDFDMVFYVSEYPGNDVEWLAYEFRGDHASVPYCNPTNFVNETYDGWIDQLLHGVTYDEVYEAAAHMQMILHENVPRLVVYETTYMQAYRNDRFKDHIRDLRKYISGQWTLRHIKRIDGNPGGIVPIAIPQEIETLNVFTGSGRVWQDVMDSLYSSLFRLDPAQHPVMDLATSCIVQTHSDNPAVPENHQRYIIDIIQNATWTDGTPLTAEDVANTFSYILESGAHYHALGLPFGDLYAAYAQQPYRVVIEFGSESYWHLNNFAFIKILPKHVFSEYGAVGFDDWEDWNPGFNPTHPHVTCGPYIFLEYDSGNTYTLTKNSHYHFLPADEVSETSPSTAIPTIPPDVSTNTDPNWLGAATLGISAASIEIIIVVAIIAFRDYRRNKQQVSLVEQELSRDLFSEILG